MTKKLSNEQRQEVRDYTVNHTWKETSEKFDISEMTISRILKEEPNKKETNGKLLKGYSQFNSLFSELMKNAQNIIKQSEFPTFKKLIQDHIDIGLIKEINEEVSL